MEQATIISRWEERAKRAGVTIGEVCGVAGIAPSTFSRWKAGTSILLSTANKIEVALTEIEARPQGQVDNGSFHSPTSTPTPSPAQAGKADDLTAQQGVAA